VGEAPACRLKLLDRHDLQGVPAAIKRRAARHRGWTVDQPQRRVIADRPAVRDVPPPGAGGPFVPPGERRHNLPPEIIQRPETLAFLHDTVISERYATVK